MNPFLKKLQSYPFERLASIKANISPPTDKTHISLSIGEPKHSAPEFVLNTITENLLKIENYPTTKGSEELRQAIASWASQRFQLKQGSLTANEHVLPVNGTREALFAFTQVIIDETKSPLVISPNPFYQIYEGASFLAGADLKLVNCLEENNYLPDFSQITEKEWQRCQLLFLCSPGNPSGQTLNIRDYQQLIALADRYNFIIASDECYSELYRNEHEPPAGLLQACAAMGRDNFHRCIVFHSLSKRSNLPGLRSGFVAGDKALISAFLQYRTYHGCAMPLPTQLASIAAWGDEEHVKNNREQYRQKYATFKNIVDPVWPITQPPASFYLWAKTPINDVEFASRLFKEENITVLPGRFLSRPTPEIDPGEDHVRMALVASIEECEEAAHRIKSFIEKLR